MPNAATSRATPARLAVTDLVADSPPTGERFELAASARTAADGHFRFVWTLAPGRRGPGEHYHEDETETFEIVSGSLRIWVRGEAKDYHPGDVLVVEPKTPHRFLNAGTEPAVINVSLSGSRMEDLLAPIAAAARGRKPTLGELLRMFVGVGYYRPSVPSRTFERHALGWVVWILRLFRVRQFERVER